MAENLIDLLNELEQFGAQNDAAEMDSSKKMLNISHDTGLFLAKLVQSADTRTVLEIGTSNGYATLWLAQALAANGIVTTVEQSAEKIKMATANFERAGLNDTILQVEAEAGALLKSAKDSMFDCVFLDADHRQYLDWWMDIKRTLRTNGVLLVNNACIYADEMHSFFAQITNDIDISTKLTEIGGGVFIGIKTS